MSCIQKYANAYNNSQFFNRTRQAYVCKNFSWHSDKTSFYGFQKLTNAESKYALVTCYIHLREVTLNTHIFCAPIKEFSNFISHCRNTKSFRLTFSLRVLRHIYGHICSTLFCRSQTYPKERKCSLQFKFCYFANNKFAKHKFRLLLYLESSQWELIWVKIQKSEFANI